MDLFNSITILVLIVTIALNLLLAVLVFRNDPTSSTNRLFSLMSLTISIWLAVMFISTQPTDSEAISLLMIRLSIFVATPMSLLFFLFAHTMPSKNILLGRKALTLLLIITGIVMAIAISPLAFANVEIINGIPNPEVGPGMAPFAIFSALSSLSAIGILLKRFRSTKGTKKRQYLYVAIGLFLMVGFTIGMINLPVTLFRNNSFVSLSPVFTLLFIGLMAYAILKHRLFDIKVIATEAITIVLWIVLFSKLFVSESAQQLIVDTLILVVVMIFGIFLIRSVIREVKQRTKLEELTKKLEELDEQKDEFVNVAAHELRAPMTAIKGYLSMIQEGDAGEVSPTMADFLKEAVEGNERLIRLVNNMLNVSRIEEGRMVFNLGEVDLNDVVKTVVHEYQEQAEAKKLKLKLETSKQARYPVTVDKDRIYEVVSNLISNALKYTDKGTVTVKVHLTSTHQVRVEVIDTGLGMTEDELSKLFHKFYRAESNVGKQIGTGLGLYISKLLMDKFGGKIGVESKKGKGSTFWFELPIKK